MPDQASNDSDCSNCFSWLCCVRMPPKKDLNKPAQEALEKPPFACELPKTLKDGSAIKINGKALPNCLRFAVNLKCAGENGDIAFHFNPRLVERYIVRNCKINGFWANEETASISKFDVSDYEDFKISILIAEEEYMVSLNGKHVCSYRFRIPLAKLHSIEVQGNVEVKTLDFTHISTYPEVQPEDFYQIPIIEGDFEVSREVNLPLPLTAVLPTKLKPGWQLNIFGRVKLLPYAFYVNLQEGKQIWPHPNIPLHINPRFNTPTGENVMVRNAWFNGAWGNEERLPNFTFSPGTQFSIGIRKDAEYFSVWVDNNLTGEFRFRCPADDVDTLYIQGDVFIQQVVLEKKHQEAMRMPPMPKKH